MNLQHALMYCSASTINFSSLNQWYSKWGLRPLPGSTISRLSVIIILRQYLFFSHSFSHKCKVGVSKLSWSAGQIRLCPFIYIFPSAVFSVQQQSWVTVTENMFRSTVRMDHKCGKSLSPYGPQHWKYLVSGPLQNIFANPCSND